MASDDVAREVAYIIRRAQHCDSRVVSLGQLVYFSTYSGDAWMLDPEDHLALCLTKAGDRLPVHLVATATSFEVGWTASYQIDGDAFVMIDASGSRAIVGYPVQELAHAERAVLARRMA
jgi:hypothetical protein